MTTWVLVANAAEAHLYSSDNLRVDNLRLVKDFLHPDSRKKVSDLISDKPGHYKTDAGSRGAFIKSDPKEVEAEHFALQLVKELKTGYDNQQFFTLVVVTPHHFYSLMDKHLKLHLRDIQHIAKDYTKYTLPKLLSCLREQLFV